MGDGKMPMNHQITYLLQDIFNLVPDLTTTNFVKSINVNTNDQMLVIYAASLIRSIIALHNLINNKQKGKKQVELQKIQLRKKTVRKKRVISQRKVKIQKKRRNRRQIRNRSTMNK